MTIAEQRLSQMPKISTERVTKAMATTAQNNLPLQPSFQEVFARTQEKTREIVFSKHAQTRLEQRNITLSADTVLKINEAVKRASSKGIKDSLILTDRMAFIVNIASNTVVTAMNDDDMKKNVFTNIDGTVII